MKKILLLLTLAFAIYGCENAKEKNDVSFGYHLTRNQELIKKYGVTFIPRVFLISPKGKILYTRHEEKDDDLKKLNSILQELISEGS